MKHLTVDESTRRWLEPAATRLVKPAKQSMSGVKAFQDAAAAALRKTGLEAKAEWPSFASRLGHYSPRVDIAVGPFAVEAARCGPAYNTLLQKHSHLIRALLDCHRRTIEAHDGTSDHMDIDVFRQFNFNARCFMAFEIENQSSRKHLMGSAVNAAALGRIGVAVGWSTESVRSFIRLRTYLRYLASVDKNSFDVRNLLIVSKEQLSGILKI